MENKILKFGVLIFALMCSQALSAQIRVACIGNSITYGYGLSSPEVQSFPARLQELLGSGYEVSNFGVSGSTMLRNSNHPYWYTSVYNQALELNPDIVIIMLGTNDAKLNTNWRPHGAEFKDDYKDMINSFRNLTSNPKIWPCLLVPSFQTDGEIPDSIIHDEVNPHIQEVAFEEGLSLIDLHAVLEDKESMYQPDGIHPDIDGAQEIARYMSHVLLQDTLQIAKYNYNLQAPAAVAYQWYVNGSPVNPTQGGCEIHFEAPVSGSYHVGVRVSDSTQTIITSETVTVERPNLASAVTSDTIHLSLYPNPCLDFLTVRFDHVLKQKYEFAIYTTNGSLVYAQLIGTGKSEALIQLHSVPNGNYVYQLKTVNRVVASGTVGVRH